MTPFLFPLTLAGVLLALRAALELFRARVLAVHRYPNGRSGQVVLWTVIPRQTLEFETTDNGCTWRQWAPVERRVVVGFDAELCRRAWRGE